MLNDWKLKMYNKYIAGFAYEYFTPTVRNYGIKTYLVIKKGNYYSFVYYMTHTFIYSDALNQACQKLINLGYQPLSYWTDLNLSMTSNKENTKTKRFVRK